MSSIRLVTIAIWIAGAIAVASPPASAQLIVFDPNSYAQNILIAARSLQQINNQIVSLQNQSQMLINQARNLASLPYSSLRELEQSIDRTRQLLAQAQRIGYDVAQIDRAFAGPYALASPAASDQSLIANARQRWQNSVAGFQDAMRMQASIAGNLDATRSQMTALVGVSQNASGSLQTSQAGNQLVALGVQQLADLTALSAAQGRAQILDAAQRQAAEEQGREQLRRFLSPGRGYQTTNVEMFHR